jgi:hypothetical protein
MALVRKPTYLITLTYEDRDKNTSTVQFAVDTVNTILEITIAIDTTIIPAVNALTNAVCKGWSITTSAEEDDPALLAPEESDVQRKGVFSFSAANGAPVVLQIPSIRNTLVVDRSNVINNADAVVTDFVNMVTSPAVLALVRPRSYLGSDIVRFEKAYKIHRASKKG